LGSLPESRHRLIDFAYHAALCHDFGKLFIIDTIFVYGRDLLDMEFDEIRQHPDIGYMLLSANSSTKQYADVARGHHVWYDGSQGYPDAFDTSGNPLKTVIDIVALADCMDAATDSVGRSYREGKTLEKYEQEVILGAGTRYASWGPDLLRDARTRSELEYLLGEGRLNLYRETYQLLSSLDR
jgi:HD-GYP domain-containing protein (c-di-GMP phosphodiesterase class II)